MKTFLIIVCIVFCISNIKIVYAQKIIHRGKIDISKEDLGKIVTKSGKSINDFIIPDTLYTNHTYLIKLILTSGETDKHIQTYFHITSLMNQQELIEMKNTMLEKRLEKYEKSKIVQRNDFGTSYFLIGFIHNEIGIYRTTDLETYTSIADSIDKVDSEVLNLVELNDKRLELIDSTYIKTIKPLICENFYKNVASEKAQIFFMEREPAIYHSYLLTALRYSLIKKKFPMFKKLMRFKHDSTINIVLRNIAEVKTALYEKSLDIKDINISVDGLVSLIKENTLSIININRIVSYEALDRINENIYTNQYKLDSILSYRIYNNKMLSDVNYTDQEYLFLEYTNLNTKNKLLLNYARQIQDSILSKNLHNQNGGIWYKYVIDNYRNQKLMDIKYKADLIKEEINKIAKGNLHLVDGSILEYVTYYVIQEMNKNIYSSSDLLKTIKSFGYEDKPIEDYYSEYCVLLLSTLQRKLEYEVNKKGKKVAYFFANNEFEHHENLNYPIANAQEIADILEEKYGYAIHMLPNISKEKFEKEWTKIKNCNKEDEVIIYIASHGGVRKDGKYVLVFNDTDSSCSTGVVFRYLASDFRVLGINRKMLILDACYSTSAHEKKLLARNTRAANTIKEKNIFDYATQLQYYKKNKNESFTGMITSSTKIEKVKDDSRLAKELINFLGITREYDYNLNFEELGIRLKEGKIATFSPASLNFSIWNKYNEELKKKRLIAK